LAVWFFRSKVSGIPRGIPESFVVTASQAAEKAFSCHSEACFSPKNLSVGLTYIEERFFASLRMTQKRGFSAACSAATFICATTGLQPLSSSRATRYGGGKLMDWSERSTQSCTSRLRADLSVSPGFGNVSYSLISTVTTTPLPPFGGTSALSSRKLLSGL